MLWLALKQLGGHKQKIIGNPFDWQGLALQLAERLLDSLVQARSLAVHPGAKLWHQGALHKRSKSRFPVALAERTAKEAIRMSTNIKGRTFLM